MAEYDRISGIYSVLEESFKSDSRERILDMMDVQYGENVLEIGVGTGHSMARMAEQVGEEGSVCGLDISPVMISQAKERLVKTCYHDRTDLILADALSIPFSENVFDAVLMSFSLELFHEEERRKLLGSISRVLKPRGRICVLCLSSRSKSVMRDIYETIQERFPDHIDCVPIDVVEELESMGYTIGSHREDVLYGLPVSYACAQIKGHQY